MIAYAPIVGDGMGSFDIRPLRFTLEGAKQLLDAERVRAGQPMLEWKDEFGGSTTNRFAKLVYEVRPVEIDVQLLDSLHALAHR